MIAMQCPKCGHAVEVHDSQRGKDALCPQCGGTIKAEDSGRHSRTEASPGVTRGDHMDSPTAANPVGSQQPAHTQDPPPVFTTVPPVEGFAFLRPPQGPNELGWLGHYRVERLLGRGGMGMVFQAMDVKLQRSVALKVMKPEVSKDNEFRQRFLREARATAAIKSDHIVMIHQVDQQDDVPFLAMEYLQGVPLNRWIDDHPKPSVASILRLAMGIADGLAAAHERQLVHRDIKPANIWVEQPGDRIKILDFGLARGTRDESGLTETGLVLGTPEYMAPEQAEGAKVDERCDLFSLGCVLYQLGGGGQRAFSGANTMAVLKAVALKEPTPLQTLNPDLPPAFCELVTRLLAKDPTKRPPSARSVLDALKQIAADPAYAPTDLPGTPSGTRALPFRSGGASSSRLVWFVMAGCLLVLAGAVFVSRGWFFHPGGQTHGPRPTAQGVAEHEIVLGITAPFSGPSQELGRELEIGINAYLRGVNDRGGVNGRRLRLIALDDAYDPDKALANVKQLDRDRKVFAYLGNVGTVPAEKTLPYALDREMLFFAAFTGAPLLREVPPARYVFNYRASYEEETAAIVRYLLHQKIKPHEIAVFAQQDSYGDAGFNGVAKELRNHNRDRDEILRVGYERNRFDHLDDAVKRVLAAPEIKAVVMVPTYKPAARFIKQIRDARPAMIFTNVSFVGSDALAEELLLQGPKYADGVIVTQVVPHPDSSATLVRQYRNDLKKYYPSARPNFTSLEGYIDAMLLVEGIQRAKDNVNTESVVGALETIQNLDIGLGTPLKFSKSIHQASDKVWGTKLDKEGKYHSIDLEQ